MARMTEFVLGGEAFRLMAWHDDEKKQNFYSVKFIGNDKPMRYEELLDMVSRMHMDMDHMFYQWQDEKLDNQMVNMMERDWPKEEETEGSACRG